MHIERATRPDLAPLTPAPVTEPKGLGELRFIEGVLGGRKVRIAVRTSGNPAADRVVVGVHGYSRNSRDFSPLLAWGSEELFVVVPDIVGRGDSAGLPSGRDYTYDAYLTQMEQVYEALDLSNRGELTWVGTCMGGVIGMIGAAEGRLPITRLVLNDIGNRFPAKAIDGLTQLYTSDVQSVTTFEEAKALTKQRMKTCVPRDLDEPSWDALTHATFGWDARLGRYVLRYDRGITEAFETLRSVKSFNNLLGPLWGAMVNNAVAGFAASDVNARLEAAWRDLPRRLPVHILHGSNSTICPPEMVAQMKRDRPGLVTSTRIDGVGHAPVVFDPRVLADLRKQVPGRPGVSPSPDVQELD